MPAAVLSDLVGGRAIMTVVEVSMIRVERTMRQRQQV